MPMKTEDHISTGFNKIVRRSRLAEGWERAWPRIVSTACTGGLFLAVSWAGCWQYLPPAGRAAGAFLFAAAFLASPFRFRTGNLIVSRQDAIRRIDLNTGAPERHARFLGTAPAEGNSPEGVALWNQRREACWAEWGDKLRVGKPSPDMNRYDPLRLRYAIAATTIVAALSAGDQWQERLTEAFDWSSETPSAHVQKAVLPAQVTAWVSPPEKIDKAPRHLTGAAEEKGVISAHKASVITILVTGQEANITVNGVVLGEPKKIPSDSGDPGKDVYQYESVLTGESAVVAVENGPTWTFEITPDNAPKIEINAVQPAPDDQSVVIDYKAEDDYGVEGLDVIIVPDNPDPAAKPLPSGRSFPIPVR